MLRGGESFVLLKWLGTVGLPEAPDSSKRQELCETKFAEAVRCRTSPWIFMRSKRLVEMLRGGESFVLLKWSCTVGCPEALDCSKRQELCETKIAQVVRCENSPWIFMRFKQLVGLLCGGDSFLLL